MSRDYPPSPIQGQSITTESHKHKGLSNKCMLAWAPKRIVKASIDKLKQRKNRGVVVCRDNCARFEVVVQVKGKSKVRPKQK
jgi:hypothetical protein